MRTIAAITFGILLGGLTYVAGSVNADVASATHSADAAACARLSSLRLPNATVTSVQVVPAGAFKPPAGAAEAFADLPAFCRVELTLKPSSDSDIKSETWLPLSGWNGKFQEVGNGGWNGFIQYAALATALEALVHDEPRRHALGRAAQARARERFSAEVIVPRYEALYRRLCR